MPYIYIYICIPPAQRPHFPIQSPSFAVPSLPQEALDATSNHRKLPQALASGVGPQEELPEGFRVYRHINIYDIIYIRICACAYIYIYIYIYIPQICAGILLACSVLEAWEGRIRGMGFIIFKP